MGLVWSGCHQGNLSANYTLLTNLDSSTAGYDELAGPTANDEKGWQPIGTWDNQFTGTFDGQQHEISDLYVDRPDERDVGLFGFVGDEGAIGNVGLMNVDVTGDRFVGGLVGYSRGTVSESYATGSVTGDQYAGGLMGVNWGTVGECYTSGNVTARQDVGGLVGANFASDMPERIAIIDSSFSSARVIGGIVFGDEASGGLVGTNYGTVSKSYATGPVSGEWHAGGLVGSNRGSVSNSYSTGNVTGNINVGGLVGQMKWHRSRVSDSYASGSVTGSSNVGGLVGYFEYGAVSTSLATGSVTGSGKVGGLVGRFLYGTVSDCYASGSVTGGSYVGGLVGLSEGNVRSCYAVGSVTGSTYVGGLVGRIIIGTVTDSFWDTEASGIDNSHGGTGKTMVEMMDIATFRDTATEGLNTPWDIATVEPGATDPAYIWNIVYTRTYPFLSWEEPMTPIADWHDLDAVRHDLGGRYLLIQDLDTDTDGYADLAGPTANDGKGWRPIGTGEHPFTGKLHGHGCEIRHLFINRPDEPFVGLFGCVGEQGIVRGLGLASVDIAGDYGVGALVGENRDGTVSNSYSSGGVIGGSVVGGLVGQNSGMVTHSSSTCDVTGSSRVGGLVGENPHGSVSSSYATGAVSGEQAVGGLVGENPHGSVSSSYATGTVTGEESVGGLIGGHYSGTVHNSHYNYDEVLINGESIITVGALYDEDFDEWLANDRFLDIGERLPQEQGYYVIGNVIDLKQVLAFGQDGSLRFRLDDHLDLGSEPGFYIPYLAGEFRGYGHVISNLSLDLDCVSQVGLFGYLAPGGTVTELGVKNVNISGDLGVGGVAGVNWGGTISNSYSTGIAMGSSGIGGLVGVNREGTVSDSHSSTDVAGDHDVGGLVGHNRGDVRNSYSAGGVTGHSSAGGLLGHDDGTVGNSFWDMDTSGMEGSGGGTGKTTVQMMDIATFTDTVTEGLDETWDMTAVAPGETNPAYTWSIVHGESYPFLSRRTPSPEIRDWHDLHAIRDNLGRDFVLLNNLDSATAGYAELAGPYANDGKGWEPIGDTWAEQFTGTLDGQGYEIRDLFIDLGAEAYAGLFQHVGEGGVIENLGVVNATVTGGMAGGLVVWNGGTIDKCYFAGNLTGEWGGWGSGGIQLRRCEQLVLHGQCERYG
jgi:hypothetical protein